jgi:hypothetical protein
VDERKREWERRRTTRRWLGEEGGVFISLWLWGKIEGDSWIQEG